MTNSPVSALQPETLNENRSMHSFIHTSYNQAKKQLQDGASFIKEELTTIYDIAGNCLNLMVLPVNNFLKDLTQIETDFEQEASREPERMAYCNIIPIEQALKSPMEENY